MEHNWTAAVTCCIALLSVHQRPKFGLRASRREEVGEEERWMPHRRFWSTCREKPACCRRSRKWALAPRRRRFQLSRNRREEPSGISRVSVRIRSGYALTSA